MIRLLPLLLTGVVCAQEINIDHIVGAVSQIETGTVWKGPGVIHGEYTTGRDGEVGPWQITPGTLSDIGRSVRRCRDEVQYAERSFRIWYAYLLRKHGDHGQALAAYNGGSAGRHRKAAKEYAQRALNLAERLASEEPK